MFAMKAHDAPLRNEQFDDPRNLHHRHHHLHFDHSHHHDHYDHHHPYHRCH
ncbi:unnamed protein product [Trichogramma brassicae]|uniref:Uncharacterized protein n=1 Tax=Trichogramma brassicae TaxID=86971 RepID=A0A6H5HWP9_9HYME|nr:unnamed protein product [Trichogramma brassicae]